MQLFPLTLAAIKKADQNQWSIGDALIKECGAPSGEHGINDGSRSRIAEAAKYLFGEGFNYSVVTLSQYRLTADRFGDGDRISGIAWGAHHVAQNPEFLKAVIAGAPKGTRISEDYVDRIRQRQADDERRERKEAAEKARKAREKAEQEEAEARAKAREAKEEKEKQEAKTKLAKAEAKTEKAKEHEKEVKTAPKKKVGPPAKEDIPLMAKQAKVIANAAMSVKLAKESAKYLQDSTDELNKKGIAALIEAALEAANAWTELARLVRREIVNESGHLSVVGD